MAKPLFIFDGDCGFCTAVADFARKRFRKDVEIIPWQFVEDLDEYSLTSEDVMARVYWVENGQSIGGGAGVARGMLHMKAPWKYIGRAMLLPGISHSAEPIYRFIARNRYRFPGSTPACRIQKHH